MVCYSEECQKPQAPLLLKKVSQYTSHLYCNAPCLNISISTFRIPYRNRGLVGGSIEIFNVAWKFQSRRAILNFFNLWALRETQPPLLLKKSIAIHTSNLYCNTPPICIAVLSVPLRSEEREILSVLLPFVSQYATPICIAIGLPFGLHYASHLYRSAFGKILVVVVTGMLPSYAWSLTNSLHKFHSFLRKNQILGPERVFPRICLPQDFGEVRVNFLVWILTKTLHFMCRRPELFRKFLGRLRMILCYWKTFSVPKNWPLTPILLNSIAIPS